MAETKAYNDNLEEIAQQEYEESVAGIRSRNQARQNEANRNYEEAHAAWMKVRDGLGSEGGKAVGGAGKGAGSSPQARALTLSYSRYSRPLSSLSCAGL